MIGEISALGCAFTWSLTSVLTKSLAPRFSPLALNLLRCLGASVFFWCIIPFFPGTGALLQTPLLPLLTLALSAVLGICLGDTIYIKGLGLINVTLAFPLAQASMPVFTLAAAALFLGEPLTGSIFLGTALVIGGVVLMAAPEGRGGPPAVRPFHPWKARGMGMVLLASVLWTASISLLKVGLQDVGLVLANGIRLPVASLVLIPLALGHRKAAPPSPAGIRDVFLGALAGALSFGLGGIFFLLAIQEAGAGKAAVLTSSAPLFGLPLSALYLKEPVTPRLRWGTVLVVGGVLFLF